MTLAGGRRAWREAATLILTARQPAVSSLQYDYRLLMLQRSARSKFMPNAFVFPGGVVSEADFSEGWSDLFRVLGHPPSSMDSLVMEGSPRPLLMGGEGEGLARHVAFRLTAIRETFEESGVLLLSPDCGGNRPELSPGEVAEWRAKVHNEPEQLLQLCRELGAVPDIWALSEWSDWLTPTDLKEQGTRRFDTIFYTAHLPSLPNTQLDQAEVTAVQWEEPDSLLKLFRDKKLWLAPPQVYEVSRLLHFKQQEELQQFAKTRETQGLVSWLPVRLQCTDGLLSLLPGDSMYPEVPDYVGDPKVTEISRYPGTMSSCLSASSEVHRLQFVDSTSAELRVTAQPRYGHVNPVTGN